MQAGFTEQNLRGKALKPVRRADWRMELQFDRASAAIDGPGTHRERSLGWLTPPAVGPVIDTQVGVRQRVSTKRKNASSHWL